MRGIRKRNELINEIKDRISRESNCEASISNYEAEPNTNSHRDKSPTMYDSNTKKKNA